MPRYSVNTKYFDHLVEESAYWLGFILCDGCIFSRRGGREWLLQVKLQVSDTAHVESLRAALGYTGPLRNPVPDAVALCLYSRPLCHRLVDLGVKPNKTYKGVHVPTLPKHLNLPMAQGMFDANGTASKDTNGLKLGISGPKGAPYWFARQVAAEVPRACAGSKFKAGPMRNHTWHGNKQVRHILEWLQTDTGAPRLARKQARIEALLEVQH